MLHYYRTLDNLHSSIKNLKIFKNKTYCKALLYTITYFYILKFDLLFFIA